jgi:hypothetical protein
MTDTTTETALMIANQLNVLVIFDEMNSINSLGKEASALIRALVAERDEASCARGQHHSGTQFCAIAVDAMGERDAANARVRVLEGALRSVLPHPETSDQTLLVYGDFALEIAATALVVCRARTALEGK